MTGEPGVAGRLPPTGTASTQTGSSETGSREVADAVAAAVLAVPGVTGLHGGAFGQAATYYRGRTVSGVQLRPESTTVHVVLAWGVPLEATAALVRQAVAAITGGPVDVVVEDLDVPVATTARRVT